jgi:hypothetical protein
MVLLPVSEVPSRLRFDRQRQSQTELDMTTRREFDVAEAVCDVWRYHKNQAHFFESSDDNDDDGTLTIGPIVGGVSTGGGGRLGHECPGLAITMDRRLAAKWQKQANTPET